METDFQTADGEVRIIDFMPVRQTFSSLVRIVVGLRGNVKMRSTLRLRFDYGALPPWSAADGDDMIAKVGPNLIALRAPITLHVSSESTVADFDISPGQRMAFVLSYARSDEGPPEPIDGEAALASTQHFWRDWIGRFDNSKTDWPFQVRRSLITLKALIHRRSGGLIAAPTTSLPEAPGGEMNWDYRYCWLRDASFTLTASSTFTERCWTALILPAAAASRHLTRNLSLNRGLSSISKRCGRRSAPGCGSHEPNRVTTLIRR